MSSINHQTTAPLVSVVITTYGNPTVLSRAVDSVLRQTYDNVELIVVDDNGLDSDNHKKVVKELDPYLIDKRLTLLSHEVNRNGSAARNTGAQAAKGEFLAFLDDDDEFTEDKIRKQVDKLLVLPDSVGGCYCQSRILYSPSKSFDTSDCATGDIRPQLLTGGLQCNTSTFMFRRQAFDCLSGFDDSFRRHQDWEFIMRFCKNYNFDYVDEVLVVRHREDGVFDLSGLNDVKMHDYFIDKFQNDIGTLDNSKQIYHQFYFNESVHLLRTRNFRMAFCSLKKASSHLPLTRAEKFQWVKVLTRNMIKTVLFIPAYQKKRSINV